MIARPASPTAELDALVNDLRKSPEAQRLIAAGFFQSLLATDQSGQSTTEAKDSAPTPENEMKPESEQKIG